ncbi:lytic murein transglycosylase [Aeromicrobium tamlense]|uniref:Lytic murein transglycosylase n=1 Tax=Aeromicrobium tamlense TaxID=375541 RepID=A0A8I0FUJ8_9ACTN|nr:lytic murein transglycosylase [Aeromicrobium tamlense]MBD1270827.1 lytic murein transglycosylase [Aeromicrobium tamlense]NYI38218.1 membrane-bound lytic murein transglycosylase B [Aeromicrobium tamlense]
MTSRILLLGAAVLATVGILVAWLVVGRGGEDDPISGPAAQQAEEVPLAEGSTTEPDADWVTETAADRQIPVRAMQAYARTEISQREAAPECNLRWNTLAGVGSVESAHGTLGGAGLDAAGVPSKRIIGPPLNGENGTRAIEATKESTALHGDEEWDRAVGPFQFLTSSWEQYGADADGDGRADPHDIDDAALGAANHLCDRERDLAGEGWVPAVFAYNNSMAYVKKVRGIADSYAK